MEKRGRLTSKTLGGKYRLGGLLGNGGAGAVYRGQHLLLNRPQAIKVLLEHYSQEPKFVERFLREAQTIAALDHPHIVHIDDFGIDEPEAEAYLVMPFIDGGTFDELLKGQQEPLSVEQVVIYLEQICSALDYAHQQGVVHLDLKPQNLLIRKDGELLLSDFGLAHYLKQEVIDGGTSLRHGTPHYMAPEHSNGQPNKSSDIYALGVMLFQMLVSQLPFRGTLEEIVIQHRTKSPPLLRSLRPELPIALEEVLERALAKQAEQRFLSAGTLLIAFKGALTHVQEQVLKAEGERLRKAEEERARKAEEERLRRAQTPASHQRPTTLNEDDEKVEERPFRLHPRPYDIPPSRQTFNEEEDQLPVWPERPTSMQGPQKISLPTLRAPSKPDYLIDSPIPLPLPSKDPIPTPFSTGQLAETPIKVKFPIPIMKSVRVWLFPWLLYRLWCLCQKPSTGRLVRFWFDNSEMLTVYGPLIPDALKQHIQFACAFYNACQASGGPTLEEADKRLLAVIAMKEYEKYLPKLTNLEILWVHLARKRIGLPLTKVRISAEQAEILAKEEPWILEPLHKLVEMRTAKRLAAFWLENYVVLALIGRRHIGQEKWEQMRIAYKFYEACKKADNAPKKSQESMEAELAIVKAGEESHKRGIHFTRTEGRRIQLAHKRLQAYSEQ